MTNKENKMENEIIMTGNGIIPLSEQTSHDDERYIYTITSTDNNINLINLLEAGFNVSSLIMEKENNE